MAYDAPGAYQYTWNADVDFSDVAVDQFTAVAIGPAQNVAGSGQGNTVVVAFNASNNFIGIIQNVARAGEGCTVMLRGISRCQCATAWTCGQKLKVVAGGQLAPAGSGDTAFAVALESAVPGDISTCLIK